MSKTLAEADTRVVIAAAQQCAVLADVTPGFDLDVFGFDSVTELRDGVPVGFRVQTAADDPVIVLYTIGSTGLSKGVLCTNRILLGTVFEASLTEEGNAPGHRRCSCCRWR